MPPPERPCRHVDTSRSPSIATMEQFLRGGDSTKNSPTYSPSSSSPSSPYFERMKHQDMEEDHGLYQRKSSVLMKVKEKARKLRYSLSKKKQEDENLTPSWGVSLEEEEGEEEDAEYLGAPIYESELAPEEYKENARQHPRANPVISEKRVLKTNSNSGVEQDQENALSPVKSTTTTTTSPNRTLTETLAQKLTAANVEGLSNSTQSPSSKTNAISRTSPTTNMSSQTLNSSIPSPTQNSSSLSNSLSGMNNNTTSSKGASMKDYLVNKCEPEKSEKTTSQVTCQAISPRRASSNNGGVIDRVKGAVNSLLRNEEPSYQKYAVKTPTTRASPQITNTHTQEVGQEENHGRILQAN